MLLTSGQTRNSKERVMARPGGRHREEGDNGWPICRAPQRGGMAGGWPLRAPQRGGGEVGCRGHAPAPGTQVRVVARACVQICNPRLGAGPTLLPRRAVESRCVVDRPPEGATERRGIMAGPFAERHRGGGWLALKRRRQWWGNGWPIRERHMGGGVDFSNQILNWRTRRHVN